MPEDNTLRFSNYIVQPDFEEREDPEDEDLSDCNLLSNGMRIIGPEIEGEELGMDLIETKPGRFELRTK